jgi:hypothetical protein
LKYIKITVPVSDRYFEVKQALSMPKAKLLLFLYLHEEMPTLFPVDGKVGVSVFFNWGFSRDIRISYALLFWNKLAAYRTINSDCIKANGTEVELSLMEGGMDENKIDSGNFCLLYICFQGNSDVPDKLAA